MSFLPILSAQSPVFDEKKYYCFNSSFSIPRVPQRKNSTTDFPLKLLKETLYSNSKIGRSKVHYIRSGNTFCSRHLIFSGYYLMCRVVLHRSTSNNMLLEKLAEKREEGSKKI